MAAYRRPEFTRATIGGDGESVRVQAGIVGPGFFELLGTAPVAGRALVSSDFTDRATAVVISATDYGSNDSAAIHARSDKRFKWMGRAPKLSV